MYNDPQGSYPPPQPNPQWNGNGSVDNTQNYYPPPTQNPAPQWGGNGISNPQPDPYSSPTQNIATQNQWGNVAPNLPQGSYPPQSQVPPPQGGMVYRNQPRRSGLVSSRGTQKNNLPMAVIAGVTAIVLIVSLVLFVTFSNKQQQPSSPVAQTNTATPTPAATTDTTTPTPEATATPIPTPTIAPPPTTVSNTTTTYSPPPVVQPPAPISMPTPIPTPKPTATPGVTPTVNTESFSYDYNATNGTLVTNPPANFCTAGHEASNAGVQCVADFSTNATGYVITCKDGKHVSHAGGNGACSTYKGEGKKWYKHPLK